MHSNRLAHWLGLEFDVSIASDASILQDRESIEDAEKLLRELDDILDANVFNPRVSAQIHRRFEESLKQPRADLFIRFALVGTIVYNLFLFLDALIVPDAIDLAAYLQLGVATPMAAVMMVAIRKFDFDANRATILTIMTMVGCTILIFMASRSPHIALFPAIFTLFIISANVAQALPFKHALGFTTLSIGCFSMAVLCHPSLDMVAR